jgi:hypothetical protein
MLVYRAELECKETRLSWRVIYGEEGSLLMMYSRVVVDGLVVQASYQEFV